MGNTDSKAKHKSSRQKIMIKEQQKQIKQIKHQHQQKTNIFGIKTMIPNNKRAKSNKMINPKLFNANPIHLNIQEIKSQKKKPFQNPDRRRQVDNSKFPYSAIGYLVVCFQDNGVVGNICFGTAYLIAHNIAITAAHNVYSRKKKKIVSFCTLILGQIQKNPQEFIISYAYVPSKYIDDQVSEKKFQPADYAMLILQKAQKLGQSYGIFQITPYSQQQMDQNIIIDISGYPQDMNFQKNNRQGKEDIHKICTMFGCQQRIKQIKNNMFYYDKVHTNEGQSGSPIIALQKQLNRSLINQKATVIGIHTGGDDQINHGVIITSQILQKIIKWIFDFERKSKQCYKIPFSEDTDDNKINNFILNHYQDLYNEQANKNYIQRINKKQNLLGFQNSHLNSEHLVYLIRQIISIDKLKQLNISRNKISNDGIKQLCRKKYKWNQLSYINLTWNSISMDGIKYLSRASQMNCFPSLKHLYLGGNRIGSNQQINSVYEKDSQQQQQKGILFKIRNLKQLQLYFNNINDNDMKILFERSNKANNLKDNQIIYYLQKLDLATNKVSTQGIKILVSHPNIFSRLKFLNLGGNTLIEDQSIHEFVKGCHLGAFLLLQFLNIQNVNISDKGINELIKEEYKYTYKSQYKQQSLKSIKQIRCFNNPSIKQKVQARNQLKKRFKKNKTQIII